MAQAQRASRITDSSACSLTRLCTVCFLCAQGIVDTYGVPRYKEANPGLFTLISFPFLFGIMYGDIGHGTLLFLFALYLLFNEKKFLALEKRGQMGEIPSMVFGGRYLLVMMGAFALYAGTIYSQSHQTLTHTLV